MNKLITLALVGRGHWGSTYQKTIREMRNVNLPEKYIFGRDYMKGLKKIVPQKLDGIVIAATTSAHFEIASKLLKRGFHNLLIEKPLTQTFQQASKLLKLFKKIPNAKILVGHLMLYDPAWIKMKAASKKLGKILQINYTALKGPPIKEGTVLQDAGSHPIYLFIDFAGNPKNIFAANKKNDNIELTMQFESGIQCRANIGTIYPERKRGIEIIGEKGSFILNEFVNPRKLLFISKNGGVENISFPKSVSPLKQEILEFVNVIGGKKSKVPLESGIKVVKIIELAEKSLKMGEKISFK